MRSLCPVDIGCTLQTAECCLVHILLGIVLLQGCEQGTKSNEPLYPHLDVQGHRGCRGSLPENSMTGFVKALELGVTTLEMDVVISKDQQVVLSHEPFLSHHICLDSLGKELDPSPENYNIFQMTYEEIARYDCGSLAPAGFPIQQPVAGPKPLLSQVIQSIEKRARELDRAPVNYNIETKSRQESDGVFHPEPHEFVSLVLRVINEYKIKERTTIQSFDPRTLKEVKKQDPDVAIALLVANPLGPEQNIDKLGFQPDIYSPQHQLVTASLIRRLHEKGIAVIPWTVNETYEMTYYIEMGVDGIITDYPDSLLQLLHKLPVKQ